jgi:predicted 3-demethylubiquinone-9 3-methyltransferase (glyoxalase superfamily)
MSSSSSSSSSAFSSQQPVGIVGPEAAEIAKACQTAGVPFVGIYGISHFAEKEPSTNEQKLAFAQKRLLAQDFKKLQEGCLSQTELETSIVTAVEADDLSELERLLFSAKYDRTSLVNVKLGYTLLHYCGRYRAPKVMSWVLADKKVNVSAKSFSGQTPLHYATRVANVDAVKALIAAKADPAEKDNLGNTPLQAIQDPGQQQIPPDPIVESLREICAAMPHQQPPTWLRQLLQPQKQPSTSASAFTSASASASAFASASASAFASTPCLKKPREVVWVDDDDDDEEEKQSLEKGWQPPMCVICLEKRANTLVLPCEHVVVCSKCAPGLVKTADASTCVQCRQKIESIVSDAT